MSLKHKQEALLKVLNYLLAYRPDEFGLFPDEEGYISIDSIKQALSEEEEWKSVKKSDILEAIRSDKEGKFEIKDEKVRSIEVFSGFLKIPYEISPPPKTLYCGIKRKAYPFVREKGLIAPKENYIALTPSKDLALRMAKRRDPKPLVLEIHAYEASKRGVRFLQVAPLMFLAKEIPPAYILGPPLEKVVLRKKARAKGPKTEEKRGKKWERNRRKRRDLK
jgi:putative RNA 2'-phosphotransferase